MKTYPSEINVPGPNAVTLQWIQRTRAQRVAELGVYRGHTSLGIAKLLGPGATLDLFDFEDVVQVVAARAREVSSCTVRAHGNSYKLRDSYNTSLKKLLATTPPGTFLWDYVFIDGAHTWDVDGFSFLLCDMLLAPGGHIDLDDYQWTLESSAALGNFQVTLDCYTQEQIREKQVATICELLVARRGYEIIVPEKIYKKHRKP